MLDLPNLKPNTSMNEQKMNLLLFFLHAYRQAALLIWARTGAQYIDNVVFLDHDLIELGTIECTFLLRPLNRTSAIDHSRGHERWIHQVDT